MYFTLYAVFRNVLYIYSANFSGEKTTPFSKKIFRQDFLHSFITIKLRFTEVHFLQCLKSIIQIINN